MGFAHYMVTLFVGLSEHGHRQLAWGGIVFIFVFVIAFAGTWGPGTPPSPFILPLFCSPTNMVYSCVGVPVGDLSVASEGEGDVAVHSVELGVECSHLQDRPHHPKGYQFLHVSGTFLSSSIFFSLLPLILLLFAHL